MGNQGTALDSSREAIAQIQSGVLGTLKEVYAWSNRPVWAQGPGRRMTMEKFAAQAKADDPESAEKLIAKKKEEIEKALEKVDWKNWIGVARPVSSGPGSTTPSSTAAGGTSEPEPWAIWPVTS